MKKDFKIGMLFWLLLLLLPSSFALTEMDVADYPTAQNISSTYVPYQDSFNNTDLAGKNLTNVNIFEAIVGFFTNLFVDKIEATNTTSEYIYLNGTDINETGHVGTVCQEDYIWKADSSGIMECRPDRNTDNQNLQEVTDEGSVTTNDITAKSFTGHNSISINVTDPTYKHEFGGFDSSDAVRSHIGFDIYSVPDPTVMTYNLLLGGSVDDGLHDYKITYVTDIGETHPGTTLQEVNCGGGYNTVNLTIPTSTDPRVIARKIYRTESGDQIYQERLLATINNNVDTEYIDTAPDSALTGNKGVVNFKADTTSTQITVEGTKSMTLDSQVSIFGVGAGASLTTGGRSTFIGRLAGNKLTTGSDNTIMGHQAGQSVVSGGRNTAFGNYVFRLGTGSYNTCYGAYSCFNIVSGNDNTIVGTSAGQVMTGGSNNVFLGEYAGGTSNQDKTASRSVAIGSESYTDKDYQMVLGNDITEILVSRLNGTKLIFGNGLASTNFDGLDWNFNNTATGGEFNFYNSTGWAILNAHDFVTHTYNTSENPLEMFTEDQIYYDAYTEIIDLSKPKIREICNTNKEYFGNEPEDYNNITNCYDETYYPHTKLVKGQSTGKLIEDLKGVAKDLNRNMNLHENLTDFDTGIMAENIYTQSKTPDVDVEDYIGKLKDKDKLKTKKTHYAYVENIMGTEYDVLDLEERVVVLEGAVNELFTILCNKNILKKEDGCMN